MESDVGGEAWRGGEDAVVDMLGECFFLLLLLLSFIYSLLFLANGLLGTLRSLLHGWVMPCFFCDAGWINDRCFEDELLALVCVECARLQHAPLRQPARHRVHLIRQRETSLVKKRRGWGSDLCFM